MTKVKKKYKIDTYLMEHPVHWTIFSEKKIFIKLIFGSNVFVELLAFKNRDFLIFLCHRLVL